MNTKIFEKLLPVLSVFGVIGTAILSSKAAVKTNSELEIQTKKLSKKKIVKVYAKNYIPTAIIGGLTIASVVGSDLISSKKQANLIAAYTALSTGYKKYQGKVKEVLGIEKEQEIFDKVAKDNYKDIPEKIDEEKTLFYDEMSGKYFWSTEKDVIVAEYELNHEFQINGTVTLNRFYELLEATDLIDWSRELGWSASMMCRETEVMWIETYHNIATDSKDHDFTIIRYEIPPQANYEDY